MAVACSNCGRDTGLILKPLNPVFCSPECEKTFNQRKSSQQLWCLGCGSVPIRGPNPYCGVCQRRMDMEKRLYG